MYYVYILARPNDKPFYVGKGKDRRIIVHEAEARSGCKCHKCNVIRKIWRSGGEVQRYTVFTTDDETEALDFECAMIALLGRSTLTNKTDGGEGVSNPPLSVRKIIGDKARRRWDNPHFRERVTSTITAVVRSPEYRRRHAEAMQSPALRTWRSEATAGYWQDAAYSGPQMDRILSQWDDPVYRDKTLAAQRAPDAKPRQAANIQRQRSDSAFESKRKAASVSPEARAKATATRKERDTPERRAQRSAQAKARWQDPEFRARMLEKRRAQWANTSPEARTSMRAGLDAGRRARWEKSSEPD